MNCLHVVILYIVLEMQSVHKRCMKMKGGNKAADIGDVMQTYSRWKIRSTTQCCTFWVKHQDNSYLKG